jgi:hypothetical protein
MFYEQLLQAQILKVEKRPTTLFSFALFGSSHEKAALGMLMTLTLWVSLTNIL